MTDPRAPFLALVPYLPPEHQIPARLLIQAMPTAQAAALLASFQRYAPLLEAGDIAGAIAAIRADYPQLAPMLASLDAEGILSRAHASPAAVDAIGTAIRAIGAECAG